MIFKLHYFCLAAGANALGLLLGVYMAEYTDATTSEIGLLYMLMPFVGMIFRPIICSMADRSQSHRQYIILCELLVAVSFMPFVIIPYLGPDIYEAHPRFCWYFLVSFKIMGDIAFGGAVSIGDSLAINYAARIGTEFSTYRIWSTISWMIFGFITGQLNEIWFLPKYVAAFMVLISVSLLDALVCFIWPKEYFVMITASMMEKEKEQQLAQKLDQTAGGKSKWSDYQTRSLMPRDVVWAHAKKQLWSLITLKSCLDSEKSAEVRISSESGGSLATSRNKPEEKSTKIGKKVQIQTLFLLMRRDPRIVLYLIMFIMAGASIMPSSFFFMSLSDRCHSQHTCEFSKLTGYLQISMASIESVLFMHIKTITKIIGRLNTLTLAFGLAALKFLFYATVWSDVDPHWSLVSEIATGLIFATFLTVQVEMGHLFSTEVEHLIPELMERGVISADDETNREKLKLSLSATMQALIASANDGLGRGLGALVYGLIIDAYSYETLWAIVSLGAFCVMVTIQSIAMFERCCHLRLGFDHLNLVDEVQKTKQIDVELQKTDNKLSELQHDSQHQSDGA